MSADVKDIKSRGESPTRLDVCGGTTAQAIPDDLKLLVRIIMKTFYKFEHYLCAEMMFSRPNVQVDHLAELLFFSPKSVRNFLADLKRDKFVRELPNDHFVFDYKMFIKVVTYKLNRIRERLELDNQNHAHPSIDAYRCTNCGKGYSEDDMKDLFLDFRCRICASDSVETLEHEPTLDLLIKFNQQTKLIFDLLKRVQSLNLSQWLSTLKWTSEKTKQSSKHEPERPDLTEFIDAPSSTTSSQEQTILDQLLKHEHYPKRSVDLSTSSFDDSSKKPKLNDQRRRSTTNSQSLNSEGSDIYSDIPTVSVHNKPIPFDEVTPEIVCEMSDDEKEDYINVCRQLYEQVYEN